ncbi:MAG: hypothetical protein GY851_14940 [bacterium]|nr:hypothetical protein [bacterium]
MSFSSNDQDPRIPKGEPDKGSDEGGSTAADSAAAPPSNGQGPVAIVRFALSALIVAIGVVGLIGFATFKKPPAEIVQTETPVRVEVVSVKAEDFPVAIAGVGQVKSLDVVSVVPEVAGKIVEIHPKLEVGQVIPAGETLFVIDPRTYEATVREADGMAAQLESTIAMLKTQMTIDKERLVSMQRTRDLAEAEFKRRKDLFEKDQVGALSTVEATEQAFNQADDAVKQMTQAIALYPIRIREAQSGLESAKARAESAGINLERTRVVAPFNARVKTHSVEVGQYVAPGMAVAVVANDSVLEITVPVDSVKARKWLPFNGNQSDWFSDVTPVTCAIRWSEDKGGHVWEGTLNRVESFSENTRMLYVAVRVTKREALSKDGRQLPLVEGMFCTVSIPGRVLEGVYRLPEWSVSFDGTVYTSVDDRLQTAPVEVVHTEGDFKFVRGLDPGKKVVITRLIDPLENCLLKVSEAELAATDGQPEEGAAS